ncbi:3525_t:CDS:1, partial [Scutellospora calospora]
LDPFERPTAEQLYKTFGGWLCKVLNIPSSNIAKQFQERKNSQFIDDKIEVHSEATYNSRYYNFKELELPNITFTKTNGLDEHLAVRQHIIDETKLYNIKLEMIHAENSSIAAKVHELLDIPKYDTSKQFQKTKELQFFDKKVEVHSEVTDNSDFKKLKLPTIRFTKTNILDEDLAVRLYIADETKLYNIKVEMIRAENTNTAAAIYEILKDL